MEIAIIAHDGKKVDLVNFLIKNKTLLLQEEWLKVKPIWCSFLKIHYQAILTKQILIC